MWLELKCMLFKIANQLTQFEFQYWIDVSDRKITSTSIIWYRCCIVLLLLWELYSFGGQLSQIISCRPRHMPGDIYRILYTVVSKIYHGLMWINNIEIEKTTNNPPHVQLHAPSIPVGGSDKPKSEMRNEKWYDKLSDQWHVSVPPCHQNSDGW